jgi:hypothetical protein
VLFSSERRGLFRVMGDVNCVCVGVEDVGARLRKKGNGSQIVNIYSCVCASASVCVCVCVCVCFVSVDVLSEYIGLCIIKQSNWCVRCETREGDRGVRVKKKKSFISPFRYDAWQVTVGWSHGCVSFKRW